MSFQFPTLTAEFYLAALPIFILLGASIVALLQGVSKSAIGSANAVFAVVIAALIGALVATGFGSKDSVFFLGGSLLSSDLGRFGQSLILALASLICVMFRDHHLAAKFFRGEIASLFLMIVSGMLVMVASEEMVTLFVGLELSSIGLYALVGYINPTRKSQEGAIKYFVLGSFAAALLLYGFALLYAATGSMRLSEIVQAIPKLSEHLWVKVGVVFTIAGLGFKLALAPFHLWAPDTYEAAPTGVTAFMATSVKIMIMIVAMRLFSGGFNQLYEVWLPGLTFLAMLSMILGNVMALVQNSLKRMLAYSSVAHSGYMAISICAISGASGADFPAASILYYLLSYTLISVGAFGALMWLETERNENLLLDDLSGLAKSHPFKAFLLAVFMFAFAGMPPTVGFISKFFVFNAALSSQLYALVLVGVVGSSISLFYYLRVIVRMYMTEANRNSSQLSDRRSYTFGAILAAAVVLVILLGTVLPGRLMQSLMSTSSDVSTSTH